MFYVCIPCDKIFLWVSELLSCRMGATMFHNYILFFPAPNRSERPCDDERGVLTTRPQRPRRRKQLEYIIRIKGIHETEEIANPAEHIVTKEGMHDIQL